MLIDCPACARSYHVGRDEIGAQGRTVVCPRCHEQWFVDADGRQVDLVASAVSARIAPRRAAPPPRGSAVRVFRPYVAAVAGLASLMVVIGARDHVVRVAPRLARLYAAVGLPVNVRGLEFSGVTTARLDGSVPTMTLSGEIRNVANRRVRMPRVAYEVRDGAGSPLLSWSEPAPARMLAAGKSLVFTSQPHDIPAAAQAVLVHFQSDDAAPLARITRDDR